MNERLQTLLDRGWDASGPIVVLTGAGISAESGIPTFRGQEGYWTVGSRNYHPQEMATYDKFCEMPEEVWRWYLYRRSVCRKAQPNAAHRALVDLEQAIGDRFLLVTQNVDGLHLRAGNTLARTYQIHGNIDFLRCDQQGRLELIPLEIGEDWTKESVFDERARAILSCCAGRLSRPHVLWFDESYDEERFRFESAIRAAQAAAMLIVIGTSGQTSLPAHIVSIAARRAIPLLVINQDESDFSAIAERSANGLFVRGPAGAHVPGLCAHLVARARA